MIGTPDRIVDAHHHFWDLEGVGSYPWLQEDYNHDFFLGDYTAMRHTFLPEHYRKATAGFNVIGTVHVEAERSRNEQVEETRFLQTLHAADSRFPLAAVGHASFTSPQIDEILDQHASSGLIRGIRSKPVTAATPADSVHGERNTLHDPAWIAGLARLEKYDFSWDLRVPFWHLREAAEVLTDLPGVPVVINHCGLPVDRTTDGLRDWRRGLEALAALPQVMIKISELGLPGNRWDRRSNERVVAECLDIFGFERAMFASNLPVATLTAPSFREVVDTVLHALPDATADQIDRLFARTAAQFYRVELSDLH